MDDEALTPDEIAEQLSIAVGEAITSEPQARPPAQRPMTGRTAWCLLLPSILILLVGVPAAGERVAGMACLAVVGLALLPAAARVGNAADKAQSEARDSPWVSKGDPTVEADAFGLRLFYRAMYLPRCIDWTEVEELKPVYGPTADDGRRAVERWAVTVEGGGAFHFRPDAPNGERVLAAVRHAVEARRQGRRLWDPDSVPDGAITRMTGDTQRSADRGISPTEE